MIRISINEVWFTHTNNTSIIITCTKVKHSVGSHLTFLHVMQLLDHVIKFMMYVSGFMSI